MLRIRNRGGGGPGYFDRMYLVIRLDDAHNSKRTELDAVIEIAKRFHLPLNIVTNELTTKETERAVMEERIKSVIVDP
jgi:hypothetical protein